MVQRILLRFKRFWKRSPAGGISGGPIFRPILGKVIHGSKTDSPNGNG